MNKVIFEGCLIEDPKYNRTKSTNVLVSNFRVINTRKYLTSKKESKEEKCFVNVVAWLKIAEICQKKNLQKRDSVWIEGRLQSKSWISSSGERKDSIEIMAESIRITNRRNEYRLLKDDNSEKEEEQTENKEEEVEEKDDG